MRKKFQEGGEVKPVRRASRLSGPLGKVGKFGVATGLIPGMASNMLADVYGQAREAALGPFEEEGLKALAEERQRRQTARALPTMTPNYEEEMAAAEPTKRRSKPLPVRQRQYKKGGPVKKYEGGGMVEIEIKVGGGGKKGKHMMPDGSMMDDSEHESEEYKKGGAVKGGKWIQNAIKKPGALRAQLGVKEGQKIPAKKLATAAKAPGKLGQRARFAQTLSKMRKK